MIPTPPALAPAEHAAVLLLGSAIEHEHLTSAALWPHLRLGAARALRELAGQTRADAIGLPIDDQTTLHAYAIDLERAAHAIEREDARESWARLRKLRWMLADHRGLYIGIGRDALRLFVRGGA